MQVIVYPTETGVAVVYPAPGFLAETVAAKDVPEGAPFLIVDSASLPSRAARETWQWTDFTGQA